MENGMAMTTRHVSRPHSGHRKRMFRRLMHGGFDGYHEHEILEQLLFEVIPRRNTNELAHALIARFWSLAGVFSARPQELMTIRGVGKRTADFLTSVWREAEGRIAADLSGKTLSRHSLRVLRDYFLRIRGLGAAAVLFDGEGRFAGFFRGGDGEALPDCRSAAVFSADAAAGNALAARLAEAGIAAEPEPGRL